MTKETKTTAIAAGLVGAISVVFLFFVNNSLTDRATKEAEHKKLDDDIKKLDDKCKLEGGLTIELDNLKANFAQYIKILPSPEIATQERLMELLQDKSERTGFRIEQFVQKPQVAARGGGKKAAVTKAAFQEVEITLNGSGTFEQFLRFLNSLERHESFIRVNSFNCTAEEEAVKDAEGKDIWPLQIALNISTFRFTGSTTGPAAPPPAAKKQGAKK